MTAKILLILIRGYQLLASPVLGGSSRFLPTCSASAPAPANPAPSIQPAAQTPTAAVVSPGAPSQDVVVDNADVHAVFSTRGAVLKNWQLKKYRDDAGRPLELIAGHAPADAPLPF